MHVTPLHLESPTTSDKPVRLSLAPLSLDPFQRLRDRGVAAGARSS